MYHSFRPIYARKITQYSVYCGNQEVVEILRLHYSDITSVWFIGIPMAVLGGLVLKLPIYTVYAMILIEEIYKLVLAIYVIGRRNGLEISLHKIYYKKPLLLKIQKGFLIFNRKIIVA